MSKKMVITIARQYGSAGRDIGRMIAKKMNILCLDRKFIVEEAVKLSGIHEDLLRNNEEKAGNTIGQAFSAGGMQSYFSFEPSLNDKIFLAEAEVIRKCAGSSSCVIIGRCASYILRGYVDHLSVFVNADLEFRMRRAVQVYGDPEKRIKERILKIDKQRAHYHSYYTDEKWMGVENYDLTINSAKLGVENTAELILASARCVFDM